MIRRLLFLLLIGVLPAAVFPTALGECTLEIPPVNQPTQATLQQWITAAAKDIRQDLGPVPMAPYQVSLMADRAAFYKQSRGRAPEWSLAVTLQHPDRVLLLSPAAAKMSFSRLKKVIYHELNHVYLNRITHGAVPGWFLEGMAMRTSGELSLPQKVALSRALWKGRLDLLTHLNNMHTRGKAYVDLAYAQSAAAVAAMEYAYGESIYRLILDRYRYHAGSQLPSFPTIFKTITGDDLLDFQEKYTEYLRLNYSWLFLLNARRAVYFFLALLVLLGSVWFRRRHNKAILERWEEEEQPPEEWDEHPV